MDEPTESETSSVSQLSASSKEYLTFSQKDSPPDEDDTCVQQADATKNSDDRSKDSQPGLFQASRRKKIILVLCTMANFISGCSFSLPAPFFPDEATAKGMSQTFVGVVFSSYELMIFIFSPFFGNYLAHIGPKFVHLSCIFSGGTSTLLFGTLCFCPPGPSFIALSIACRVVQGIGYAGFVTASFAIVSIEFSDRVTTAFGIIETGALIGFMLGPVIGGALFSVGGFVLPFWVLGGVLLLNGLFLYGFLPTPRQSKRKRETSVLKLLRIPMVYLPMCSICLGCIGLTFIQPTLYNHIKPFGLSPALNGLFFAVHPFLSCVFGPVLGFLTDTKNLQEPLIILGHFFAALGFLIAGPAFPFLPFAIWTVAVGLALTGITYECTLIPTLKCMVIGTLGAGFEDDIDTYAILSGLMNFSYYFGGSLGPLIGGFFGFDNGAIIIAVLNLFVMTVCLVYFRVRKCTSQ